VTERQCAILYINAISGERTHVDGLRALGFQVHEASDLPPGDPLEDYHAVVIQAPEGVRLPVLAARLRAKPRFGRRVMIAVVPDTTTERQRREAVDAGFDLTMPSASGPRDLGDAILSRLRRYPEHHCVVRTGPRTSAA